VGASAGTGASTAEGASADELEHLEGVRYDEEDNPSLRRIAEYERALPNGVMPANQKFERIRLASFRDMHPDQLALMDQRVLAQVIFSKHHPTIYAKISRFLPCS
jgi:hypothetical protein